MARIPTELRQLPRSRSVDGGSGGSLGHRATNSRSSRLGSNPTLSATRKLLVTTQRILLRGWHVGARAPFRPALRSFIFNHLGGHVGSLVQRRFPLLPKYRGGFARRSRASYFRVVRTRAGAQRSSAVYVGKLEIIGEAVKQLSNATRERCRRSHGSRLPACAMVSRTIYFGVDRALVWRVVEPICRR